MLPALIPIVLCTMIILCLTYKRINYSAPTIEYSLTPHDIGLMQQGAHRQSPATGLHLPQLFGPQLPSYCMDGVFIEGASHHRAGTIIGNGIIINHDNDAPNRYNRPNEDNISDVQNTETPGNTECIRLQPII